MQALIYLHTHTYTYTDMCTNIYTQNTYCEFLICVIRLKRKPDFTCGMVLILFLFLFVYLFFSEQGTQPLHGQASGAKLRSLHVASVLMEP